MKRLVTEQELEHLPAGSTFEVTADVILTPSARDYASTHGVALRYPEGRSHTTTDSPMDRAIREAVLAELGRADQRLISAVKAGVPGLPGDHAAIASAAARAAREAPTNRAVLSAMGVNRTGILSRLSQTMARFDCDVHNVSQTLVDGYFTMILIVEIDSLQRSGHTFDQFRDAVLADTKALGLEAMLMHEDVLRAMHRI